MRLKLLRVQQTNHFETIRIYKSADQETQDAILQDYHRTMDEEPPESSFSWSITRAKSNALFPGQEVPYCIGSLGIDCIPGFEENHAVLGFLDPTSNNFIWQITVFLG